MMLNYYEGAARNELILRKNSASYDRSKFYYRWSLQGSPLRLNKANNAFISSDCSSGRICWAESARAELLEAARV